MRRRPPAASTTYPALAFTRAALVQRRAGVHGQPATNSGSRVALEQHSTVPRMLSWITCDSTGSGPVVDSIGQFRLALYSRQRVGL